ncbi:MAG: hypothetical protein ACP5VR_04780 [Acidimicrobiales bacterium]
MRLEEVRDEDGSVLVPGLHPSITVVAASPDARAAISSAVAKLKDCTVLKPADLEEELRRAAIWLADKHRAAVSQLRQQLDQAERDAQEAATKSAQMTREATLAATELSRFDELAQRLNAAHETYETSVHANAEAARSLAAALGELERILGQRHTATASLEQARNSRDHHTVPDVVVQQAMNLQAALASAEADRRRAVLQADDDLQAARLVWQEAYASLEQAHQALRTGMETLNAGPVSWAEGVPLTGLLGTFRDRLAETLAKAQTAASHSKSVEHAVSARLEQQRQDLESLLSTGPPVLDPLATASQWVSSDIFTHEEVVVGDDTFNRFEPKEAASLVSALASRGCQVIYLTEDPEMLGWAISLPHEMGSVTTIASSHSLKAALLSPVGN